MKHEIDLANFSLRTDLMIETIDAKNDKIKETEDIYVTEIEVDKNLSKKIERKIGNYITIEFQDVTDIDNQTALEKVFKKYLKKLINKEYKRGLIIGLGNISSTPDSLGPKVIENIVVTTHILEIAPLDEGFSEIAAIAPGVTGDTGIETYEIIKSMIDIIKPDYVIAIDALATLSIERLNKTIQMSDTGIKPGSGIGNFRKEISKETLGIPVISIGIPTVLDAVSIVSDTFNYIYKNYEFNKEFINNPMNKIVKSSSINYLKKEYKTNVEDKKNLLGMIGELSEEEVRKLIYEVLTPIGYNLMVTPKEIDFTIKKLSQVLSNGINETVHPKLEIS